MDYDVLIIGAGMSGLAAGIRLAHFEKRVCILERHYAFGGLNSYYKLRGREFDVGLHAVTNYTPCGARSAPLAKLLRQLRLTHDDFALHPQRWSEIRFPHHRLRFSNDTALFIDEVVREFPSEADRFRRFVEEVRQYDDSRLDVPYASTRSVLTDRLREPALVEMLLCSIMYYGSAEENDMDFVQFVTMFKAIFLEGLARPREGVRRIIKTLVRRYRSCGGELRMRSGVRRILLNHDRAVGVELESGEELTAATIISCAGFVETMRLCGEERANQAGGGSGRLSFVETVGILDTLPRRLGHEATIVFFNDGERFEYARPGAPVDLRSGVVCCPSNYEGHDDMAEGVFRITWLANYDRWAGLDDESYAGLKTGYLAEFTKQAARYIPDFARHLVDVDMFTPRTIERYTGHLNGAVYGSPRKCRDGRTEIQNLYICGTDQGYLGIIGAALSGITIANLHVLSQS